MRTQYLTPTTLDRAILVQKRYVCDQCQHSLTIYPDPDGEGYWVFCPVCWTGTKGYITKEFALRSDRPALLEEMSVEDIEQLCRKMRKQAWQEYSQKKKMLLPILYKLTPEDYLASNPLFGRVMELIQQKGYWWKLSYPVRVMFRAAWLSNWSLAWGHREEE